MAGRRAGGAPALWRRVRWANVGRLAVLLAAGLLLVTGGRGCRADSPPPPPPEPLWTHRPGSERSPARRSLTRRETKAGANTRAGGARRRRGRGTRRWHAAAQARSSQAAAPGEPSRAARATGRAPGPAAAGTPF